MHEKEPQEPILIVDGLVGRPLRLGFDDLAAIPEADQVPDVSRFHPTRRGDGVALEALLQMAQPHVDANYVTLHANRDDFHVSVPLEPLRAEGIVVYKLDRRPLGPEHHGPIRFLVKDPTACRTGELDDCANVKYLDRIELTLRKGRDTRPTNEADHAVLHEREQKAREGGPAPG
jgi:DMSO/TMAO reductase YedYZ molybdopterin-dependent catalytic subunit